MPCVVEMNYNNLTTSYWANHWKLLVFYPLVISHHPSAIGYCIVLYSSAINYHLSVVFYQFISSAAPWIMKRPLPPPTNAPPPPTNSLSPSLPPPAAPGRLSLEGKRIGNIDDLKKDGLYVAAGSEKFKSGTYNAMSRWGQQIWRTVACCYYILST